MGAIRQPLIDLVYNDETGRYIAMLERKCTYYQLNDLRFRALLELLTDEEWEDYQFSEGDGEIQKIAADALMRRLGLSHEDASKLVQERWAAHNPAPAPDHTRTYLIGKTPTPHVISQSRHATGTPEQRYDIEKHLSGLDQARRNRTDQSDEVRHLPTPSPDQA